MTSVPRLDTTSRFAKLIVLGDSGTKKRDLLISYSNPGYPDGPYSLSHEFDPQIVWHRCALTPGAKRNYECHLYDTSGIEELPDLTKIASRRSSVAIFTFSIANPETFDNLAGNWIPTFKSQHRDVPFIVVATDSTARNDKEGTIEQARRGIRVVPRNKGEYISQKLGALAYLEANISPRINVEQVFNIALEAGIRHCLGMENPAPGLYVHFCKHGRDFELQELYDSRHANVEKIIGSDKTPFYEAMAANNIAFAQKLLELSNGTANLADAGLDYIPWVLLEWCRKGLVRELNLNNNSLAYLPLELASVKHCSLDENPLGSIPKEIRGEKWPKIKKYLEALQEKAITWNYRKVVLLGEIGVGKSAIARALGAKSVDSKSDKTNFDLMEVRLKTPNKESIFFKIWDFGSSVTAYPSHQFFLTPGAMFLIAFDYTKYQESNLEYWFKLIKDTVDNQCSILVVGTHADLVSEEEQRTIAQAIQTRFPKIRFPAFEERVIPLCCKTGLNLKRLKDALISTALNPSMRFTASDKSWVQFEELIRTKVDAGVDYVDQQGFREWATTCGIKDPDLPLVTDFLIRVGTVIHYSKLTHPFNGESYDNIYLVRPGWLINNISLLIKASNVTIVCGYISAKGFNELFPATCSALVSAIFFKFNIIQYLRQQDRVLVPFMLPTSSDHVTLLKMFPAKTPDNTDSFGRLYKFAEMPLHFFGRLLASTMCLRGANDLLSWKNGCLIAIHYITDSGEAKLTSKLYCLFTFSDQFELGIVLRFEPNLRTFAVTQWRRIIENLRTMVASFYPRLQEMTTELIPCTHCLASSCDLSLAFKFPYDECNDLMLEQKVTDKVYCNGIVSPPRAIPFERIAPDLALADLPHVQDSAIKPLEVIGNGAFGVVKKALLKEETAPVALKELRLIENDNFANRQLFTDFQVECYMMLRLNHPNIVRFYGIRPQPLGMVLELFSGSDLFQYMHTQENNQLHSIPQADFPWALRFQIGWDIASGLDYLHHRYPPIVHRDLRSPNIFLREDKTAVIGDFGLAREVYETVGGILATWQWVAPECLDSGGGTYGCRSDIYSFGMVLWELAAIDLPFGEYASDPMYFNEAQQTYKLMEIKRAIIEDDLRPTIPPDTPEAFSQLIRKCWSANPRDRPTTQEILERLSEMGAQTRSSDEIALSPALEQSIYYRDLTIKENRVPQPLSSHYRKNSENGEYVSSVLCSDGALWLGLSRGQIHAVHTYPQGLKLAKNWVAHSKRICSLIQVDETVWSYSEDGSLKVWEIDTYAIVYERELSSHSESGMMLLTSDKNVWVSSAYDGKVTIFGPLGCKVIQTLEGEHLKGALHMEEHNGMIWMSSGAAGSTIALYDRATQAYLGMFSAHESRIGGMMSLTPSPFISTFSLSEIRFWEGKDISQLKCPRTISVQINTTCAFATEADEQGKVWLLCGDFGGGVLRFDVDSGAPLQELIVKEEQLNEKQAVVQLHQLQRHLITVSSTHVKLWASVYDLNDNYSS